MVIVLEITHSIDDATVHMQWEWYLTNVHAMTLCPFAANMQPHSVFSCQVAELRTRATEGKAE